MYIYNFYDESCEKLEQDGQRSVDTPLLEVFNVRLDEALSNRTL